MLYPSPRFLPAGDSAVLVELGEGISPVTNRAVHAFVHAVDRLQTPGIGPTVAAYRSVLVHYDPLEIAWHDLLHQLSQAAERAAMAPALPGRVVVLPVLYGDEAGPDLDDVVTHAGLSEAQVIARHSGRDYLCYFLGFSPGFPYLGMLDPALHTPRLATPRLKVPAGSVGIGGQQTGVYPQETPGGWRIIGRTPVPLFRPDHGLPFTLQAGDHVRFQPVTAEDYVRIAREIHRSRYSLETLPAAAARPEGGGEG